MSIVLICGPARCGKSRLAENLAAASALPVIYLATGPKPDPEADPEWAERVQQHRQRRPPTWQTWETEPDLGSELQKLPQPCCALVDSLGGWVAQGLECSPEEWDPLVQAFLTALQTCAGKVILVSEEVGWGWCLPIRWGGGFGIGWGSSPRSWPRWRSKCFWLRLALFLISPSWGSRWQG